jgi:Asparaginase, N-terminal
MFQLTRRQLSDKISVESSPGQQQHGNRGYVYHVLSVGLSPLTGIQVTDWIRIATDIELNYAFFDAFVILHGTDTMSYTSSALSFLLEDLGKTVVHLKICFTCPLLTAHRS